MRFHYSDFTTFEFVELGKNRTAFIGKNGSGKTTYLKEMAQSVLPEMQFEVGTCSWEHSWDNQQSYKYDFEKDSSIYRKKRL